MNAEESDLQGNPELIAPDGQYLKTLEDFNYITKDYLAYLSGFDIDSIKNKPTKECTSAEFFIITNYNALERLHNKIRQPIAAN